MPMSEALQGSVTSSPVRRIMMKSFWFRLLIARRYRSGSLSRSHISLVMAK